LIIFCGATASSGSAAESITRALLIVIAGVKFAFPVAGYSSILN